MYGYFVVVLSFVAGVSAGEAPFVLTRSTIDSGGTTASSGGEFELSGTIGQPDAALLSGEDYELTGGFWFQIPPADCNETGIVDTMDHRSLTECMSGPDADVLQECRCFDLDQSGAVDLRDYATEQVVFAGP